MWISQKAFIEMQQRLADAVAHQQAAVAALRANETTLGWFMHRLTQIEQERSKLIFNYTGVKVEAPSYEKETPIQSGVSNPLNTLPNWNDVGDKVAAELGIDWNQEGEVIYGVTK